jgi:hypothetical protein
LPHPAKDVNFGAVVYASHRSRQGLSVTLKTSCLRLSPP